MSQLNPEILKKIRNCFQVETNKYKFGNKDLIYICICVGSATSS